VGAAGLSDVAAGVAKNAAGLSLMDGKHASILRLEQLIELAAGQQLASQNDGFNLVRVVNVGKRIGGKKHKIGNFAGLDRAGCGFDSEEARAIIDPALALMFDAVRRYGGYVVQATGVGIFALFGAPVANEDDPLRAARAV